jgi:hypothetical protein
MRYEREVPAELERQYHERIRQLDRSAKQRKLTVFGAVACAVIAGLIAFVQHLRSEAHARDVSVAATEIERLLKAGQISEAAVFFDRLAAERRSVAEAPELVETEKRVRTAQKQEADRVARFAGLLREAETAAMSAKEPPALVEARSIIRLSDERTALETLSARREQALREERVKRENQIQPLLEKIESNLPPLERAAAESSTEPTLARAIAALRDDLNELAPALPFVGEAAQSRVQNAEKRLAQVKDEVELERRIRRAEEEITRTVAYSADSIADDSAAFANALKAYIALFPRSPRSLAMKETVAEQRHWDTVYAWRRIVEKWTPPFTLIDPTTARERAELCRDFLRRNPSYSGDRDVLAYQQFAEAVARRDGAPDAPRTRLRALFADNLVDQVWMVKTKEEKKYYLFTRPPEMPMLNTIQFRYIITFDGRLRAQSLPDKDLTFPRVALSPQSNIAAFAKARLAKDDVLVSWESAMIELIKHIHKEPDIDPLLQLVLTSKVIDFAMAGSEPLRVALADAKKEIDASNLNFNVPWMDPDDADAARLRPRAAEVSKLFSPWEGVLQAAEAFRTGIEQSVSQRAQPVGWLGKEKRRWRCFTGPLAPPNGTLRIVMPEGDSSSTWKDIGVVTAGHVALVTHDETALAEGRPVFLVRPIAATR